MLSQQDRKTENIWQYPGDVIHYIYSEWLTWSDLSELDNACLGDEDRKKWLSSLSSTIKTEVCDLKDEEIHDFPHGKLVSYYKWLGSRQVLIRESFPLLLSALESLLHNCDPQTFCPALHSIVIRENILVGPYDESTLESSLSTFLGHCSRLERVTVGRLGNTEEERARRDKIVWKVLSQQLADNQLIKLDCAFLQEDEVVFDKVGDLLYKHTNSLKELVISDHTDGRFGMNYVLEKLIKTKHVLRDLNIKCAHSIQDSDWLPLLLEYLSSMGIFLEALTLQHVFGYRTTKLNDTLILIGTLCPKLERISCSEWRLAEKIHPSVIYQICSNLKDIDIDRPMVSLKINQEKSCVVLCFEDRPSNVSVVDCFECVLLACQRGHYEHVVLDTKFDLNSHEWNAVQNKLGPILTVLQACISEDALIDLLPEVPHLQHLLIRGKFTNRSLAAIAAHGQSLVGLSLSADIFSAFEFFSLTFSDEMISEMIRRCKNLVALWIPSAGRESILSAAQYLPKLRKIVFQKVTMSEEDMVSLLQNEDVRWPSSLREGKITGRVQQSERRECGNMFQFISRTPTFGYDIQSQSWHAVPG